MMDAAAENLARLKVADIMQNRVTTVHADTSLGDVARLLWEEGISAAPVLDDDGRLLGVISASDIVRFKAYGGPAHAGRGPCARDLMTAATIHVRPGTSVPELARFLVRAGIHRALVVEHGRLAGIVSTFDIVEAVAGAAPSVADAG
ncbi:MAG TPA: CBS domain-containing protein [Longimicrobiales bacterium]|nr:CBS domain-containing protein [Longimicrobiales bacterium]